VTLNPPDAANVEALDFEWDIARPTSAFAQMLRNTKDPENGGTKDPGLTLLDSRSLTEFTGGQGDKLVMEARLTTPADSAAELKQRSASLLREAGWFVKCEGDAYHSRGRLIDAIGRRVYLAGVLPNTPDNMVRWIRSPKSVDPRTTMPDLQVTGTHARDMTAYLYRLQ
jgi:hypothetical protein